MMPENPPAFPVVAENGLGHVSEGMSLRDYFAGQALAGLCSSDQTGKPEEFCRVAYILADDMLAERAKESPHAT